MEILIYLNLKPYIKQWLVKAYGDPVKFPAYSIENAEIKKVLTECPPGAVPRPPKEGATAIVVPNNAQRPAAKYNYLTYEAEGALTSMIRNLFDCDVKASIRESVSRGVKINWAVRCYCKQHGINLDHEEVIRQKVNRCIMWYKKHDLSFFKYDSRVKELKPKKKK